MALLKWVTKTKKTASDSPSEAHTEKFPEENSSTTALSECDGDSSVLQADTKNPNEKDPTGSEQGTFVTIPERPHQPKITFPHRTFGKQKRAFCATWFDRFPWIHYQDATDVVFCYYCLVAEMRSLPTTAYKEDTFAKTGFFNWKKALQKFEKHESTLAHRQSVDLVQEIPETSKNVGEMLSEEYGKKTRSNRKILMTILSNLQFLAHQGLALRGEWIYANKQDEHEEEQEATGSQRVEARSNFIQLLKLRAIDNPDILVWLERSQRKYTSPDIQNEMLQIMALKVLREIASTISNEQWYTIMADETTDISNSEQLVTCLRHVNDDLEVHEDIMGLYNIGDTSADTVLKTIQDILQRFGLRLSNCRGQCYDGAANMAGCRQGVATRITSLEPRALYTHCYGHSLNLAVQDTIKGIDVLEDTLNTVHEITKLIKKSPKREVLFCDLQDEICPDAQGIRLLCPTRWTVRAEAMTSIAENYQVLQKTWIDAKKATRDTEMKSRIDGVAAQMKTFKFFFGLLLGRKILTMVDNLSRSLQSKTMSANEGQNVVKITLETLQSIRTDDCFTLFWLFVEQKKLSVEVSSPELPRKRKAPERFEVGQGQSDFPCSPKEHYRRIYYQALDMARETIRGRFEQKGFLMLRKLEDLLLLPRKPEFQYDRTLEEVAEFYGSDFNKARLDVQLAALHQKHGNDLTDLKSLLQYMRSLNSTEKAFFSEIIKVIKLVLVMPATNAQSERSFSALRRLKTWLRSTMTQKRLNWCLILHVHQDMTEKLSMWDVAKEFVERNDVRIQVFGKFKEEE